MQIYLNGNNIYDTRTVYYKRAILKKGTLNEAKATKAPSSSLSLSTL